MKLMKSDIGIIQDMSLGYYDDFVIDASKFLNSIMNKIYNKDVANITREEYRVLFSCLDVDLSDMDFMSNHNKEYKRREVLIKKIRILADFDLSEEFLKNCK